jgi:hypothetical protein
LLYIEPVASQQSSKRIILFSSHKIDLYEYNDAYYGIIEDLLLLKYGPELNEIIQWFLYERIIINEKEELEILPLIFLEEDDGKQEEIFLETPEDLWNFITKIINRMSKDE